MAPSQRRPGPPFLLLFPRSDAVTEKTVEIIAGEDETTVAIRPMFPFACEGFRVVAPSTLVLFGEGKSIRLKLADDQIAALRGVTMIQLSEFPMHGRDPERELVLQRSD